MQPRVSVNFSWMNMNELNQKIRVNFREVWYYKKYTLMPFAVKCKVYGKI